MAQGHASDDNGQAINPDPGADNTGDLPFDASRLELSPDLYRALLETMTEGVSLSDENGIIVYTNPAEDRMFGYAQGELLGRHVSIQNAYPEEENARIVQDVIAELKVSRAWRGEWLNRRKDGTTFVTTSRISAIDLQGRSYWLCIQEDVTDERAAVQALADSEARLQLATATAAIGIWDWDIPSGRMRYSATAKAICGFEPDQEVTYEDARRVTHPEDYPLTSAMARRALDPEQREHTPFEYRVVRPDGTVRWVTAHGEALFAEVDGEVRAVRYVGTIQDITDRRRLEDANRTGQARLALALDAGRLAVWELDIASDQVTGSVELNRILGFADDACPSAAEIRAGYYPGEQERLRGLGQDALDRGDRTLDVEYRYVRPDGSLRWLWLRAEIITSPGGQPVRAIGVVTDVTDRRRAEEALRTSEARLKLAQHAARIGVWDWDVESGAITWSPEMYDILGLDPARDATDPFQAWLGVLHPDDREGAQAAAERAASLGEPFVMDFRITHRPSGRERWVRSQATAVLNDTGQPSRVVGINMDVTAERQREEDLRALAGELRSAVEASEQARDRIYQLSNDLFAVAGFDGFLKTINPAWERLLGYTEHDLLSRPFATIVHPEDHAAAAGVIAALQAGETLKRFEDRLITADGRHVWVNWTAVPEGDFFYAVGRDITRDKEREDALRQSQKMEAMGQLTGGVAHDFNNLLTPIIGALDLLQRKSLGGEREQRLVGGALQSADKAKMLVQRLLAFARRQPLQPQPIDVADLLRGMVDLISSTTGPNIRVLLEVPDDLPSAVADANQLEMAILNLAVNARDAMPEGGTLLIRAAPAQAGQELPLGLQPGSYLRLAVSDTGSGMDEVTLARAIEPFFSTKGLGRGTGLGLSMVHGLASQLGGGMEIRSAPGSGTVVELWIPQGAPAVSTRAVAEQAHEEPHGSGLVLLVDDEDLVRQSTAEMLIELGYTVAAATCAEQALDMLDQGLRPEYVVTDHLMPGLSGTDLHQRLKSERPTLKVLIVSGYAETIGISADVARLNKPFRKAELAIALKALTRVKPHTQ